MRPYEGTWNTTPNGSKPVAVEDTYTTAQRNALLEELESLQTKFELELEAIGDGRQLTTAQRIGALSEIRKIIEFRAVLQGLVTPDQTSKVF